MVELTIQTGHNCWWVVPKYPTANRMIHPVIRCERSDEAMNVYLQLNGKKLQDIEAFIKLRNKFAV